MILRNLVERIEHGLAERQARRTEIQDIAVAGEELSEEQLGMVAGGMLPRGLYGPSKVCDPNPDGGTGNCWPD